MATPLGQFLLGYPRLLQALTFGTIVQETLGTALLFVPFATGPVRTAVAANFLFFHLVALNLCMELGPFPYICAVAWLALLPGWFWEALGRRLPALGRAAERVAARVGSRFAGAKRRPAPVGPEWWVHVVAGVLLAVVLLWNLSTVYPEGYEAYVPGPVNRTVRAIARAFAVEQYWGMFAPFPLKEDGWYVVVGRLKDGREVDLFQDGRPVSWDKPARVAGMYKNEHWRKYLMNLYLADYSDYRPPYAAYLCRQWNARHAGDEQVERVAIYFMVEVTLPDGEAPPEKALLCAHDCSGEGCSTGP
jgi:hypothetical protein